MRLFHLIALNHGLLLAPRGMIALSTVWNEADLEAALTRFESAFDEFAATPWPGRCALHDAAAVPSPEG